jgi:hypothetical protein
MRSVFYFLTVAGVFLSFAVCAHGESILDQSQETWKGASFGFAVRIGVGQTFTSGFSGQLDHIDIRLGIDGSEPGCQVDFSFFDAYYGYPGSEISRVTIDSVVDGWNTVDLLSKSIFLTAGTQYGFAIIINDQTDLDRHVNVKIESNNVYSGGSCYDLYDFGWNDCSHVETVFRTYMTPEPGTVLLISFGALLIRRRIN